MKGLTGFPVQQVSSVAVASNDFAGVQGLKEGVAMVLKSCLVCTGQFIINPQPDLRPFGVGFPY